VDMLRPWSREDPETPTAEQLTGAWLAEQARQAEARERARRHAARARLWRARHMLAPLLLLLVVGGSAAAIRLLRAAALPTWPVLALAVALGIAGWARARHRGEATIVVAITLYYLTAVSLGA